MPKIENTMRELGWVPEVTMSDAVRSTLGRSTLGPRDIAAAVPGLTGTLLLPLRRQALILTAACTALCWVLLVVGVPVTALVGIIAAVAR